MSNKNPFLDFKSSPKGYLLLTLLIIVGVYLVGTSYFWWGGSGNTINWNVISNLQEASSSVSLQTDDGLLL
ncbi:MAG: hypothetical protein QMB24_17020, partial [Spirosomataceae bacterium]